MRKIDIEKQKRIEALLSKMASQPMNRHQMADEVKMNIKSVCKYITELRFKKQIHIARYDRNTIGSYTVYYMTGNFPDVVKPVALGSAEWNKRYRDKTKRLKPSKFVARPDFAAAWLFNPIEDCHA